jgi:antitoxin component YwqK of YwqJK toxin-antitoxin module
MTLKYILIFTFLLFHLNSFPQAADSINKTDRNGLKQGHWIRKYPNGHIQYNGYFKDNHPVGSFRRYFETDTLQSVLIFNSDGREAEATLYHTNGQIASKGKFVNQLKEGKWKFFSERINQYLICLEEYKGNIKNGLSIKYYPDSIIAEKVFYINDQRNGEWVQYFPNRNICLKANYLNGKLQGSYVVYYDNGKPQYIGQYKDDARNGNWKIYNYDGSLKYTIEYLAGVASDAEMYKKDSDYLDALEKNKGKIADPEKTGTIWDQK